MVHYEVLGFFAKGICGVIVAAASKSDALKIGKARLKKKLPPGVPYFNHHKVVPFGFSKE